MFDQVTSKPVGSTSQSILKKYIGFITRVILSTVIFLKYVRYYKVINNVICVTKSQLLAISYAMHLVCPLFTALAANISAKAGRMPGVHQPQFSATMVGWIISTSIMEGVDVTWVLPAKYTSREDKVVLYIIINSVQSFIKNKYNLFLKN